MRDLGRVFVFGLLASVLGAACNNGGGHGGVVIVVDGQGLSAAQLASVTDVWIYIDGDGDGTRVSLDFKQKMGLPTGTYKTSYQPKNHAGKLTITGELHHTDPALMVDQIIATNLTTVDIRMGNQVMATIMLAGGSGAGGAGGGGGAGGAGGAGGSGAAAACAAAACNLLAADGCCGAGCTAATDLDCACGNGVVDPGETCDPLSTCPAACPQNGCQLFSLTSAGTCQAACTAAGLQSQCVNGDGCCPAGCSSATDSDCGAACGNGVLEGAELCDGNCPASCPPLGCQLRTLTGSAATCDAQCTNAGTQTACASGDGCCPAGCTVANDADCGIKCGNGIIDSGETCDGNCPTACPAMACRARTLVGSAATCDAQCVDGGMQTACVNKDGCCPTGCTTANDSDCVAGCGNGVLEGAETCEVAPASPLCAAITCDDKDACTIDSRQGMDANCNVACGHSQITGCLAGVADGCCAAGCNATNDPDCAVVCGNGVVEAPAESCDTKLAGSCPTVCPQAACVLPDLVNAGTCKAACVDQGRRQTTCVLAAKDGCCPGGCNATNDADCVPACGNGVIEAGETCESRAPATPLCANVSCTDNDACTTDGMTGSAATCNVACTHTAITACSLTKDGCCPSGCNATNDADCGAVCGNGVLETGETCETKAPATPLCANVSCIDSNACTADGMTGSAATCNLVCTHTAITACRGGDGCCPTGCNAVTDSDCPAICNNGVLEPGETCDVAPASPTCASISCSDGNACTTDPVTGSAATCNLACGQHVAITACSLTSDGCCPSGCTGVTDADCAPSNDTCAGAVDISAGGDFPFSLVGAKTDFGAATSLKCGLGAGADVFFTFTLPTGSAVAAPPQYYTYFDVFDANGNAVNVALELYAGSCQTASPGNPTGCAASTTGEDCGGTTPWPRLLSTVTGGTQYLLIARVSSGSGGRYTLRFQRIPTACAAAGLLTPDGTTLAPTTTCQSAEQYSPACATTAANGRTYYFEKCPAPGVSADTCSGRTGSTNTVLLINLGNIDMNANGGCTLSGATPLACVDDVSPLPTACANTPNASVVTNVGRGQRGIVTVTVDTKANAAGALCGNYALTTSLVP